jgi:hypothetical protein
MTTKIMARMLIIISLIGLAIPAGVLQTTTTPNIFAQSGGAQEESEGDLTVVINGETFTTGQTITISGSVDEPGTMNPQIEVFDPVGDKVVVTFPSLSADNTFTYSFVAGDPEDNFLAESSMDMSGNYRVTVTFFPSATNMDIVDMEFEYIVTPTPPTPEEGGDNGGGGGALGDLFEGGQEEEPESSPQQPQTTIARILNVTALRDMVTQGQQQAQELNNALIRANASDTLLSELNGIQNTLQNIRGNLTGVSPQTQVIE